MQREHGINIEGLVPIKLGVEYAVVSYIQPQAETLPSQSYYH